MSKYKATAVISIDGRSIRKSQDVIDELQCMLGCWEDMRGDDDTDITISIKFINKE